MGLDILNDLIVLLQCIFVIGLRVLGMKMVDPYGDDHEDLSVILYVEGTLETCDTIMNTQFGLLEETLPPPPVYMDCKLNDSDKVKTHTTQEQEPPVYEARRHYTQEKEPPVYEAPRLDASDNETNNTATSDISQGESAVRGE